MRDPVLNSITDGIVICDPMWHLTFVNQRAVEMIGIPVEQILGRKLWDLCPNAVNSTFHRELQRSIADQVPVSVQTRYQPLRCWFEVHAYPAPTGLVILIQDITHQKQQEADLRHQLQQAEQRAALLLKAGQVLATELDCDTTLQTILQLMVPALADYGLAHRLDLEGQLRSVAALHHEPQKQGMVEELGRLYQSSMARPDSLLAQVLYTGEPIVVADFFARPESSTPMMATEPHLRQIHRQLGATSLVVVPLVMRGQALGTLLLVGCDRRYTPSDLDLLRDLADRVAMAIDSMILYYQVQESSRLKDEFLLTLSHELRTPLNTIFGWAQMLSYRVPPASGVIQQGIEAIERRTRELVRLIYDLLDLSRIITSQLRLDTSWVDLNLVLQEAIASLRLAAETKAIQIQTQQNASVSLMRGDGNRLRQIVWHLLSNAIKFTPPGGQVTIQLMQDDRSLQLTIRDTGKGIRANFLPYVFDYFRQADGSTTRADSGLGLGLSLARHLVEMHGGTIKVASLGDHRGTTVVVTFPLSHTAPSDTHKECA